MSATYAHLTEISPVYGRLMEEIKRREEAISDVLTGRLALRGPIAADLCYIELRKICELIGLACLVAHGDLAGVKDSTLQKTYKPDFIIRRLEKLHRDFYPKPGVQKLDSAGKVEEVLPFDGEYLGKTALIALYGECGDRLHRGNVRRVLAGQEQVVDFKKIGLWRDQIINLLAHHQIQMSDPEWMLWVIMNSSETGGVQCTGWKVVGKSRKAKNY